MNTNKVLILTLEEAKESLVQFWADVLADRANTVEQLREGKLSIPDIADYNASQIADQYGELCLGEKLLEQDESLDLVLVQTGDFTYEFGADKNQVYRKKNDFNSTPVQP